jgi:hypothetical protein
MTDGKRDREEASAPVEEEEDVGPPRPPPEEDQPEDGAAADEFVGPDLPKAKKRKVSAMPGRWHLPDGYMQGQQVDVLVTTGTVLPFVERPRCPEVPVSLIYPDAQQPAADALPCLRLPQVLLHEAQYLEALPCAQMYERSYMHRDSVTQVATTSTDFFITGEGRAGRERGAAEGQQQPCGTLSCCTCRPGLPGWVLHMRTSGQLCILSAAVAVAMPALDTTQAVLSSHHALLPPPPHTATAASCTSCRQRRWSHQVLEEAGHRGGVCEVLPGAPGPSGRAGGER